MNRSFPCLRGYSWLGRNRRTQLILRHCLGGLLLTLEFGKKIPLLRYCFSMYIHKTSGLKMLGSTTITRCSYFVSDRLMILLRIWQAFRRVFKGVEDVNIKDCLEEWVLHWPVALISSLSSPSTVVALLEMVSPSSGWWWGLIWTSWPISSRRLRIVSDMIVIQMCNQLNAMHGLCHWKTFNADACDRTYSYVPSRSQT